RVDRLRRRRRAVLRPQRARRRFRIRLRALHFFLERARVLTAILHARDELRLFLGRHTLETLHHTRRIEPAPPATATESASSLATLAVGRRTLRVTPSTLRSTASTLGRATSTLRSPRS